MISINQAVARKITRLRKPIWANPLDHLELHITEAGMGPWIKLYAPYNTHINHQDPVPVICIQFNLDEECYEPYTGSLPDSPEYKASVESYGKLL